jgi:hypothetical protein
VGRNIYIFIFYFRFLMFPCFISFICFHFIFFILLYVQYCFFISFLYNVHSKQIFSYYKKIIVCTIFSWLKIYLCSKMSMGTFKYVLHLKKCPW